MINNSRTLFEVNKMTKAKNANDAWEEIIESLVLEIEPPIRYIKDAIVVTKSGISYRLSPEDFVDLVAKEKTIAPEQSEIQHCSLSIDFTRIKRDVNKWSNKFITEIEEEIGMLVASKPQRKTVTKKKAPVKKTKTVRRKVD